MGGPNADLSSRGCTAHLRWRLQTGRNDRQKINPESTVGNGSTNDDSDSHGLPIPDAKLSSEPLDQHRRSPNISRFQSLRTANIPFRLRQIPDYCRTRG